MTTSVAPSPVTVNTPTTVTAMSIVADRFPRLVQELPAALGDPMIMGIIDKWSPPDEDAAAQMRAGIARIPEGKIDLVTDAVLAAARHIGAAWKGFSDEIGPIRLAELFALGMALAADGGRGDAPQGATAADAIDATIQNLGGEAAAATIAIFGAWTKDGVRTQAGILSESQVRTLVDVMRGGSPTLLDALTSGPNRLLIAQEAQLRRHGDTVKPLLDLIASRRAAQRAASNGAAGQP